LKKDLTQFSAIEAKAERRQECKGAGEVPNHIENLLFVSNPQRVPCGIAE
jgi:hypothetical protein